VHDPLLQRGDGMFLLVVWDERVKETDEVAVKPGRAFPAVSVYDPTVGTGPVPSYTDVEFARLTLSDHPVVLAVRRN
jgi:hypothetical protein